ncbi:MAG: signal peptidase II [Magnetococcales bacterium]|nr:signal peptidase II [Magnetococcales bacterium]
MSLIRTVKSWMGVDRGRMRLGLAVACVVVVLDLTTKSIASSQLQSGPFIIIPGFFDFILVHNLGAAFGLLADQPFWLRTTLLLGVALVASVFIIQQLREVTGLLATWAFGLILGGAVGNVVDRVRLGWVVDFIHVHWYDLSWPVFNLADSAITVGVILLILENFRSSEKSEP